MEIFEIRYLGLSPKSISFWMGPINKKEVSQILINWFSYMWDSAVLEIIQNLSFLWISNEHSERKLWHNLGCLKTRLDLEGSSPPFYKQECCKNAEGKNHVHLIICHFCPYSMNYLQTVCFLNAWLEHSRSNLVFETRNRFILGCSIDWFALIKYL